jgi:hypothetical protein
MSEHGSSLLVVGDGYVPFLTLHELFLFYFNEVHFIFMIQPICKDFIFVLDEFFVFSDKFAVCLGCFEGSFPGLHVDDFRTEPLKVKGTSNKASRSE